MKNKTQQNNSAPDKAPHSLPENRGLLTMCSNSAVKYPKREIIEPRNRKMHPYLFAGIRPAERSKILLRMDVINDFAEIEPERYSTQAWLPPERLLAIVAHATGIPASAMLATCRKRECVNARFLYAHFLKTLNRFTLQKIAKCMGYINHTTVVHGLSVFMEKVKRDPTLRAQFLQAQALVSTDLRNRQKAMLMAEEMLEGNAEFGSGNAE